MLFEWHITPDYIINNWTDELLSLMTTKLVERKGKELKAIKTPNALKTPNKVSDIELFSMAKNVIKEKKSGN